jgi:RNA-binding protein
MSLTQKQLKHLRSLGHALEPVVLIGQGGLTEAVTREFEGALTSHELIKLRARVGDRDERDAIFERLASETKSVLVQRIGNVGLFYRARADKPKIILPDA